MSDEARVTYKAIADFTALYASAAKAKREIRELRREEERLNSSSLSGSTRVDNARKNEGKLAKEQIASTRQLNREIRDLSSAFREHRNLLGSVQKDTTAVSRAQDSAAKSARNFRKEVKDTETPLTKVIGLSRKWGYSLENLSRWRPRLIPPFIALIPILGGLLALINPLLAGMGAVATATFGFASSLASLSGAALAVLPGLTALLSLAASLKIVFGNVGTVFKSFSALKKAQAQPGGGGGSRAELTYAEELERAQVKYAWALEDVAFAQKNVVEAQDEYLRRLREIRRALDDAARAEGRALDNARLSAEYYAEIADNPLVSDFDKQAAAAYAEYMQEQYEAAQDARQDIEDEYNKTSATGVEGDEAVIQARRRLVEATWSVRDAELSLKNAQSGTAGGASALATATNAFNEALEALSPSARAVVLFLLSLEDAWKSLREEVQESFFKEIVTDISLLTRLLPGMKNLLSATAGAAGRVSSKLLQLITSDSWLDDLFAISGTNVKLIESFGDAFLYVLDALKDVSVVAGPFATRLADAFSLGAQKFNEMVKIARSDGSLAKWLDTIYGRLVQWWSIVKGIGITIFNYGAASKEFGQWLTDGFEGLVNKWVKASEEARKEGSAFREYLSLLKGPLKETGGLVGDFFKWLRKVLTDEQNLKKFTEIIHQLRTELGPAIARVLDILAKSDVSNSLISAVAQVIDFIADFLEKGGLEGFRQFYSTVEKLFHVFADLVNAVPASWLKVFATSLATVAALTFFGLDNWLRGFANLLSNRKIFTLIDQLIRLNKLGGPNGTLGTAIGTSSRARSTVTPIVDPLAFLPGRLGRLRRSLRPIITPRAQRRATSGAFSELAELSGAKATQSTVKSLSSNAMKNLKGSAGKGIVGAIVAIIAGTLIDTFLKDGKGGLRDAMSDLTAGALTGGGIGATVGSLVPGIGTGIGAAIGVAIGTALQGLTIPADVWTKAFSELKTALLTVQNWIFDTLTGAATDVAGKLGQMWKLLFTTEGHRAVREWLTRTDGSIREFFSSLPEKIRAFGDGLNDMIYSLLFNAFKRTRELLDDVISAFRRGAGLEQTKGTSPSSAPKSRNSAVFDGEVEGRNRVTQAARDETRAVEDSARAHRDYMEQLEEARNREIERFNSITSMRETERRLDESKLRLDELLNQAIQESIEFGAVSAETQRDLDRAYEDAARSIYDNADAVLEATGRSEDYDAALATNKDGLSGLETKARDAGIAIQGVTDSILGIPKDTVIRVGVDLNWDPALRSLQAAMNGMRGVGNTATAEQIKNYISAISGVYRSTGGLIPGRGVNDSVSLWATPGEFVLRRSAVRKIGVGNLEKMNAGMSDFGNFMRRPSDGGTYSSPSAPVRSQGAGKSGAGVNIEKIEINNPTGRSSEESIIDSGRELSFLNGWPS